MSTWLSIRIASALSLNPDPPRHPDSTAPPVNSLYASASAQSQMDAFLLSPPPPLAFRSPDLHPYPSLSSPSPGSPLMLSSPISPPLSPRTFRSALANSTLTHTPNKVQQDSYSPYSSFVDHSATRVLSVGPGSSTSSDDSRSPVDTSIDTDFDSMAEYEYHRLRYPIGTVIGGAYGGDLPVMSQSPMEERKPQFPIEIASHMDDDGNGIAVSSPYMLMNGDFNTSLKQEMYNVHPSANPNVTHNDIGTMGAFLGFSNNNHNSLPPKHQSAQSYAALVSSPESPFLDGPAPNYYSSTTAHSAALTSLPQPSYTLPMHAQLVPSPDTASAPILIGQVHSSTGGEEGCDPRYVSVSPPQLGIRSAGSHNMSGGHTSPSPYSAIRFTGAFGSPAEAEGDVDGELDVDADGEGEQDDDDDEYGDDEEYLDRRYSSRRPRASLIVPSQAASISSITSPIDSSVGPSRSSLSMRLSRPTRPCAPAPVPVPNLTKKSRGRRVPTNPGTVISPDGAPRRARGYVCKVPGCGKCFARGEHLKRHIRSIHTNEKREFVS